MLIHLYIKTKNFQNIKKISKIFFKFLYKNNIKKFKYLPLVKKRTLFSLLKSPHVNKTAQEQYEIKKSNRKISIKTKYYLKSILILKKLYSKFFSSDIKLKILSSSLLKKKIYIYFNNTYNYKNKLKILDLVGGKQIRKVSLNSSVG